MLDDNNLTERQLGMDAGLIICRHAEQTAVYTDYGVSRGMEYGIKAAVQAGRTIVVRRLFNAAVAADKLDRLMHAEYQRHHLPCPETLAAIYGRIMK